MAIPSTPPGLAEVLPAGEGLQEGWERKRGDLRELECLQGGTVAGRFCTGHGGNHLNNAHFMGCPPFPISPSLPLTSSLPPPAHMDHLHLISGSAPRGPHL